MQKNLFLVLLLLTVGTHLTQAQEEEKKTKKKDKQRGGYWTVRIAGGYAWPGFINAEGVMGPHIDAFHPERDGLIAMANRNFFNDSSTQVVMGSYGKGLNYTLGLGYMINQYIGVDMGVQILSSAQVTSKERHEIVFDNAPFGYVKTGHYFDAGISTNALVLSLNPSIVINAMKPGWKVYPYARLGLTLPVYGMLTHKIDINLEPGLENDTNLLNTLEKAPFFLGKRTAVKLKTEGTVSLGVNGAIGVAFRPVPYLSIFAEVNGQYLVTRAKETKIVQWDTEEWDAQEEEWVFKNRIADRGEYRTHFVYTDKLDKNSNNADYNENYDKTKPKDDFRPLGPFSNVGFNVGLTLLLSKATLKKEKKD